MQECFKKIINEICDRNNIEYKMLSKDWIIRLSKNGVTKNIVGMSFPLNNQSSAAILRDKYATYTILKDSDIPVIEYNMIFNPLTRMEFSSDISDLSKYLEEQKNGAVVVKANDGGNGKEVFKCSNIDEVNEVIEKIFTTHDSVSVCPFYNIMLEYRLIYLNKKLKLIFGKKAAQGNWKHNLSEGAIVINDIDANVKERLVDIASRAVNATDCTFASVDIIRTYDDELLVMEINSNVCLVKFAESSKENRLTAESIYEEAILFALESK